MINKKILLISYNYAPELTGIGKYNAEMCEYLASIGHHVKAITAYPYYPNWQVFDGYKNNCYQKEVLNGVKLVRCPLYIPSKPTGPKRILQDFSFYISTLFVVMWQIITFKQYDIVITPSPSFMCGFHGLLLKLFRPSTQFVYHIQDLQIDAAIDLNIIKQAWLQKLLIGIERFILNHASIVATISTGMQQKILAKQTNITNVLLFPNWVDNARIFITQPSTAAIAALGIPLNKKVFFYSGAIGEKQGLEIILAVAPTIAQKCVDVVFVISGSGPYKEKLKQEVLDKYITNVLFIDLQPIPIFNQLLNYAYCHLVIQKESTGDLLLPSKLTNILAVGGLSIVTAVKGTTLYDVINTYQMGILITPETVLAFEQAIVNTANFNNLQKSKISENASQYAKNYLNKANVLNSFINQIYQTN
ncbi:MAG: WcaI family glycosyltransferase [Flavobacterium sp.]|nr:WcaI family glycosyltransferase [Flavobacterium sp.]